MKPVEINSTVTYGPNRNIDLKVSVSFVKSWIEQRRCKHFLNGINMYKPYIQFYNGTRLWLPLSPHWHPIFPRNRRHVPLTSDRNRCHPWNLSTWFEQHFAQLTQKGSVRYMPKKHHTLGWTQTCFRWDFSKLQRFSLEVDCRSKWPMMTNGLPVLNLHGRFMSQNSAGSPLHFLFSEQTSKTSIQVTLQATYVVLNMWHQIRKILTLPANHPINYGSYALACASSEWEPCEPSPAISSSVGELLNWIIKVGMAIQFVNHFWVLAHAQSFWRETDRFWMWLPHFVSSKRSNMIEPSFLEVCWRTKWLNSHPYISICINCFLSSCKTKVAAIGKIDVLNDVKSTVNPHMDSSRETQINQQLYKSY